MIDPNSLMWKVAMKETLPVIPREVIEANDIEAQMKIHEALALAFLRGVGWHEEHSTLAPGARR